MWDTKYRYTPSPIHLFLFSSIRLSRSAECHKFRMFQELFAVTPGFLYVGNLLRGLARGIFGLRNLHDIASHLMPPLPSPHTPYLLNAPIAPLKHLEELSTPSSSGGLIVIEVSLQFYRPQFPLVAINSHLTLSLRTAFSNSRIFFHCLLSSLHSCIFSRDLYAFVPLFPARSPTCHPLPPFRSGIHSPSRAISLAFSPVGSSIGSLDWPPIVSTLQPSGKNSEQDSVSILVSETPSGRKDLLTLLSRFPGDAAITAPGG